MNRRLVQVAYPQGLVPKIRELLSACRMAVHLSLARVDPPPLSQDYLLKRVGKRRMNALLADHGHS